MTLQQFGFTHADERISRFTNPFGCGDSNRERNPSDPTTRPLRWYWGRAARLAKRILRAIFREISNTLYLLEADPRVTASPIADVAVRRISREDRSALRALVVAENRDPRAPLERLEDAMQRGYRGYLAQCGGQILGYGWFTVDGARHPQVEAFGVPLGPKDAFGSDLFAVQKYRKHNLPAALLARAIADLRAQGYRKIYGLVSAENRASALFHLRVGYRRVDRCTAFALASLFVVSRAGVHRLNRTWL